MNDEDFYLLDLKSKFDKIKPNTQLYKQAGNSIVVNVLETILKSLLLK